jgi:opacity protein-like surface antigen
VAEPATKSWTGFYIGVEAGGGAGIFEAIRNIENGVDYQDFDDGEPDGDPVRVLTDSRHDKLDLGLEGFFGGGNIGAKQQLGSNFVIGVEGYFDFGKFKGSDSYNRAVAVDLTPFFGPGAAGQLGEERGSLSVEREWSAGVDFTPGVLVTPDTLVYGIIGANWGRFNVKGNSNITLIDGHIQPYPGSSFNDDDTLLGVKLGLGVQTRFGEDKRWSLSLDGYHIGYEDLKAGSSQQGVPLENGKDCCGGELISSTDDKVSGDLGVWEVKAKLIYQIY